MKNHTDLLSERSSRFRCILAVAVCSDYNFMYEKDSSVYGRRGTFVQELQKRIIQEVCG